MDKDRFDHKMIDIEQKSYELGMLMSVFVFEILETFENSTAEIAVLINCPMPDGGCAMVETESITLHRDTGEISLHRQEGGAPLLWDDLDLSAKEIIINELHFKYKSGMIYRGLSDEGGVH